VTLAPTREPQKGQLHATTAGGLLAIAVALALGSIAWTQVSTGALTSSQGVVVGVIAVICSVVGGATVTRSARSTGAVSGRSLFLIYAAAGFGLFTLAWREAQPGTPSLINQESISHALFIVTAAIAAWSLGYGFLRGRPVEHLSERLARLCARGSSWSLRIPSIAIWIYATGFFVRIWRISEGRFSYLSDPSTLITSPHRGGQLVASVEQLTLAGVIVAAVDVARREDRALRPTLILVSLVALEVVSTAYGATKSPVLMVLFVVAIVLTATRRRVPLSWAIIGFSSLVLVTGLVGTYRAAIATPTGRASGSSALTSFGDAAARTLNPVQVPAVTRRGLEDLSLRLRQIDSVAIIVQRTPHEIPYRSTTDLVVGPATALVPRSLWAEKPVFTTGLDFSREYYNLDPTILSASAVTVVGDLFRHGGLAVVLVGMLLLGCATYYVDSRWHPSGDLRRSVLYALSVVYLVNVELEAMSVVLGVPLAVGLSMLVSRVAFRATAP
jgi:hypothetical protein